MLSTAVRRRKGGAIIKKLALMAILTLSLLTTGFRVAAQTNSAVTWSGKNVSLNKIFASIKKQTGYVFFYRTEDLADAKPVTASFKDLSLDAALKIIFNGQPLTWNIVGNTITIRQKNDGANTNDPANINADNSPIVVKAQVLNENGEAMEGVIISVKGTGSAAITGDKGFFTLNGLSANAVFIFRGVNIETLEISAARAGFSSIDKLTTINVTTKVSQLDVVTVEVNNGYQKIAKERFVGVYSRLDSTAYNSRPGSDIISRLDGMVPGILFDKKNPKKSLLDNIQIRGLSTLKLNEEAASTQPLVILDNFPYKQSLDLLNPNDIENITVLKDAAATSIWGAQAGNGVIVITTKKGKYGQPLRVSFSSNITVQSKTDPYYFPQMKVADYVGMEQYLFNNGAYDASLADDRNWPMVSQVVELLAAQREGKISAEDAAAQLQGYKNLDLRSELSKWVYRNAITQQHFISMSAGNNLMNFSFSGGYNRSINGTIGSKPDDQFTFNTTAGLKISKNIEFTTGVNFTQGISKGVDFALPAPIAPYTQLASADGTPLAVPFKYRNAYVDTAGRGQLLDWKYRPLQESRAADNRRSLQLIQISPSLNWKINKWLSASVNYQYSRQFIEQEQLAGLELFSTRNLINFFTNLSQINPALRNPVPIGSMLLTTRNLQVSQNLRGQLNFNKTFGMDHMLSAMVAAERSETVQTGSDDLFYDYDKQKNTYSTTIDYGHAYPGYTQLGSAYIPNGTRFSPEGNRRFVSLLGNISYIYKSRYTLYGSARRDGSNVFGVKTNGKWKPLWSTGASWDIAKENFYHLAWLPALRMRASYGFSGNPTNASGLPSIFYGGGTANITGLLMSGPQLPADPNLKWEKVGMVNIGVEFGAFKNRLSGSVDVFQKNSTQILGSVPAPPSSGVPVYSANLASLRGRGFDLSLSSRNTTGIIKWQTSFNLSHSKTIVLETFYNRPGINWYLQYGVNAATGKLAYGLAAYKWGGLDPLTGDPIGYLNGQPSKDYQSIAFDSVQNQLFVGSAIPLYFGNIGNSISWKNFTLSANISYRLDFWYRKPTISYTEIVSGISSSPDYNLRWQKPGDEQFTTVPSFVYPINSNRDAFYHFSEVNLLRGDNVRLSDVGLSYSSKPQKGNAVVKNWQLFIAANNLNILLWKKDRSGYDPDNTGGDLVSAPRKVWSARLLLGF